MGNRSNHLEGIAHPGWKGDDASYSAIHVWARRHLTHADGCLACGRADVPLEWANVSGEYRREPGDWRSLCRGCHMAEHAAQHTVCRNGHPLTPENTVWEGPRRRRCRTCKNAARKRVYDRRRAAGLPGRYS